MPFAMAFLTSLLAVAFLIPQLIQLSWKKKLFDVPNENRKLHLTPVPNLGGLAIFTGLLISVSLYVPDSSLSEIRMLLAGGIIIFITGLKDDLVGLSVRHKFTAQGVASLVVAILSGLRIKELNFMGHLVSFDCVTSIIVTVVFVVGLINAYNLIDGIDGLAGFLGLLLSMVYGILFLEIGALGYATIAFALSGALVGFLIFNVSPARIFMGDSGSLLLGFMAAIFSLKFLNLCSKDGALVAIHINGESISPLVLSIVVIPVFDTLRVFVLRMSQGRSPFLPDKNHLHHQLLSLGFTHIQCSFVLMGSNVLCILTAVFSFALGNVEKVFLLFICVLFLSTVGFLGRLAAKRTAIK